MNGKMPGAFQVQHRQNWSEWRSKSWDQSDKGRGGGTLQVIVKTQDFVLGRGEVRGGLQEEDLEHLAYVLQGSLSAVLRVGQKQRDLLGGDHKRDLKGRDRSGRSRNGDVIGFWIYFRG